MPDTKLGDKDITKKHDRPGLCSPGAQSLRQVSFFKLDCIFLLF